MKNIDSIQLLTLEKPEQIIQENDSFIIEKQQKSPLQTEYIDELVLEGYIKPENEHQILEQIEIQEKKRKKN